MVISNNVLVIVSSQFTRTSLQASQQYYRKPDWDSLAIKFLFLSKDKLCEKTNNY